MSIRSLCAAAFLAVAGALPAQAVTLNVIDGQLTGASGVNVGGTLYNVSFQEGSCVSLFQGCDSSSDFVFQSQAAATSALSALSSQVLIDGAAGNFDSDQSLIYGLSTSFLGTILTAYWNGTSGSLLGLTLWSQPTADVIVDSGGWTLDGDTTNSTLQTYAVWSIAAVPVPAGLPLLLTALAGLFGLRMGRRKPVLA